MYLFFRETCLCALCTCVCVCVCLCLFCISFCKYLCVCLCVWSRLKRRGITKSTSKKISKNRFLFIQRAFQNYLTIIILHASVSGGPRPRWSTKFCRRRWSGERRRGWGVSRTAARVNRERRRFALRCRLKWKLQYIYRIGVLINVLAKLSWLCDMQTDWQKDCVLEYLL